MTAPELASETDQVEGQIPIYVDLDGTLIATDLLWESLFELIRRDPLAALALPLWLSRGKAELKQQIARRVELDVEGLPYRAEVLDYLRQCRLAGRPVILATASDVRLARAVAEHVGLFDDVIATQDGINRKGRAKLDAIHDHCGRGAFDYLGDSRADLPLWAAARRALVAGPKRRLVDAVRQAGKQAEIVASPPPGLKPWLQAMRLHQWAKNVLIFVPLVTAHVIAQPSYLIPALLAFAAFSLMASAVYILNDLLDLRADRRHVQKRFRPFASGQLGIPQGLALMAGLLAASSALAAFLPWKFGVLLLAYAILTTAYSAILKQKLMVDVLCLAALYTLRILAGGAAVDVSISPWLMAFSMFFFLSLAFAKRYIELDARSDESGRVAGRGYLASDIELVRSVGPTSGYLATLVLCLYINSNEVRSLYQRPWIIWLIAPLLLYWITRLWFLAQRRELPHDPVLFALRDRHSYLIGLMVGVLLVVATF
ncbi:MAG: membrane protein [Isosphaeraceae bacterium]|nr:MAG: membrane protein [Isosphaeraceae bacterium]